MTIQIDHLHKSYGSGAEAHEVLHDINLTIDSGEVFGILGSSGAGKSTLVRCINLLERPTSGKVLIDGRDITGVKGKELADVRAGIGMIFQNFSLFQQRTVLRNVTFPLELNHTPKAKREERARYLLDLVGLADLADRYPSQLSGGQQQRVAIARSLVNQPRVLLLDEPLGALDLKLRKEMQLELKRLQREMNITFVYVTHDQEEALTMSDTVVVMNKGNIQQIGSPQDIYNEPRNAFVAKFIGDSNIVDGIMEKDFLVSFGGQEFACVDRGFKPREPVQVVIRPEDVDIVPPSAGKLTGLVREVIFKGVHFEMHVDVEGKEWLIHSTQASQPGELIGMNIGPDEIHIMSREEV